MRFRRSAVLALVLAVACAVPALAAAPRCPLPLHECLSRYQHMRDRPWLGAYLEPEAADGSRKVGPLLDGSPSGKAGLKPGDVIVRIGGVTPKTWFAGKAGWKTGDRARIDVRRGTEQVALQMTLQPIPEETLAKMMGEHLLESHLAYGDLGEAPGGTHAH